MEVVCNIALTEIKIKYHLGPLAELEEIDKLWVIRYESCSYDNASYIEVSKNRFIRFGQMLYHSLKLAKRKEVKWFVSLNPFPYGIISLLAAKTYKKKVHFGFIGSDWKALNRPFLGKILIWLTKKANKISVCGQATLEEAIAKGISRDKLFVLPHSIRTQEIEINAPETSQYDCIFVGSFIKLKQVDIILKAFQKVLSQRPKAKLCLVGDGPLWLEMKTLARDLGLEFNVDFVGFQKDVSKYLKKAKIIILASLSEGFPYVLVEAGCAGVVPVTTKVGSIGEHIKENVNGLFFPIKDDGKCAQSILDLLNDEILYNKLRANILAFREEFNYEKAKQAWQQALK